MSRSRRFLLFGLKDSKYPQGRTINDFGGGLGQKWEKNSKATRPGKELNSTTRKKNSSAGWPGKKSPSAGWPGKKLNTNSLPKAPPPRSLMVRPLIFSKYQQHPWGHWIFGHISLVVVLRLYKICTKQSKYEIDSNVHNVARNVSLVIGTKL